MTKKELRKELKAIELELWHARVNREAQLVGSPTYNGCHDIVMRLTTLANNFRKAIKDAPK